MAVRSRLIDAQESTQQEQNRKKHRSSKSQDLNNLVQLLVLSIIVGILKHVSQNLII